MAELPPIRNIEERLSQNKHIDISDNTYAYLVAVRDYRGRDAIAPLEYERANIRTMILSRRRKYLIEDLERRVLRDAKHDESVKIFLDEY